MSPSRKNQVGQPLFMVGWQDGGVKKENAEFRMQSAEGGGRGLEGLAAKEHIDHKARRSMEPAWDMQCWSIGVLGNGGARGMEPIQGRRAGGRSRAELCEKI